MSLESLLRWVWRSPNLPARLLLPFSWLYLAVFTLTRWRQLRKAAPAPVPVVVVGNGVVGGAGKTPIVMALVRHLQTQGWQPGVISRGHGRSATGSAPVLVDAKSSPGEVGDEPLLVHRKTGAPTCVAQRRLDASAALLAAAPTTDIIVSDDGLQHHAMRPSLRICVWDTPGLGNRWLLPAGPLREPWPPEADCFLCTDATLDADAPPSHRVSRSLAASAVNGHGQSMLLTELARSGPIEVWTAIARPERFLADLAARGLVPSAVHAYPDHYSFSSNPGPSDKRTQVICTEKDAVKLWRWLPQAWAIPLEIEVDQAFWAELDARLRALSSRHGSQAA